MSKERDVAIRHPVTHDTWVLDGRTGRTREVVPASDVERAREEGARILAEATDDFVAAQRLAPYPKTPDVFTHERIGGAIDAARREEREACARHVEALAVAIRDHGPTTAEGLLTAAGGAMVGALLDAAASLRLTRDAP